MREMKPAASPLLVAFREVRHDQPDDCLHYEPVALRGAEMDWTIPAHRHEGLHQFQIVLAGHVKGEIDGEPLDAAAPLLLVLAPGAVHGFRYSSDVVGHQVTVPSATLRNLLGPATMAQAALGRSFVLQGAAGQAAAHDAASIFEAIASEFRGARPARVAALLAHATLLAVTCLRHRPDAAQAQRPQGTRDALVQRYRALLEAHYREHRPLAFYAQALQVTPDHLSRTCRQVAGQSALELLHERLMLEARRLLAYTPAPVIEIAQQLGYDDAAYFSKFFSRCVGRNPTAYRDQVARGVREA
jgi:AraC family transcriptional activator of pobA